MQTKTMIVGAILGFIILLSAACNSAEISVTTPTAGPVTIATATETTRPTPLPPSPTPLPPVTPTPDLAAMVIEMSQPRVHGSYLAPDGQWQAEIVIYDCVQVNEQDINAYEQLKLIEVRSKKETVADSQLLYCGGLGAFGLDGLFWSPNSQYFYYTDAREGVPDGCGYWERPVIRLDVKSGQSDHLGGGSVAPDGTKLATWQGRELVVWDINGVELGCAPAAIEAVELGPIVWAADSQKLVYLQVASHCPLSGNSYLVTFDLSTMKAELLLESDMPTFGAVEWAGADQVRLFNEQGQAWLYDLRSKTLAPE
jgi:hypothetical protein